VVKREIGSVHGMGKLLVYDIAHRIGAYFGKSPALVYLHRGTKKGCPSDSGVKRSIRGCYPLRF